jgi:hypothetical protein
LDSSFQPGNSLEIAEELHKDNKSRKVQNMHYQALMDTDRTTYSPCFSDIGSCCTDEDRYYQLFAQYVLKIRFRAFKYVQLILPFVQVQKIIGQFVSILHTTTCDLYFTSYVNNKVNAENDAWDMNQFDGFRDDSDCSRKVHFTYFYRTHGVEQSSSDAGSYAHALLFPQAEANVGEVKACVREITELGEELLLSMETCKEWEANCDKLVSYWKGKES